MHYIRADHLYAAAAFNNTKKSRERKMLSEIFKKFVAALLNF